MVLQRRNWIVLLGVAVLFVAAGLSFAIREANRRSKEWEERSQALVHEVCQVFGKQEDIPVRTDVFKRGGFAGYFDTREIMYEDFSSIRIAPMEGILLGYVNAMETVPANLRMSDAISKEKAVEIAQAIFKKVHIGENLPEGVTWEFRMDSVSLSDTTHHAGVKDDLDGGQWHVGSSYSYGGIPTQAVVTLTLSAYSGRVLAFRQLPIVTPVLAGRNCSKDEAIQKATKAMGISMTRSRGVISAEERYVYPQNPWWKGRGVSCPMRLVWEVKFNMGEQDPPALVGIDCETGKAIMIYK